ncbi:MAG: S1C family serine protease [Dehalococcoidia bacterium]
MIKLFARPALFLTLLVPALAACSATTSEPAPTTSSASPTPPGATATTLITSATGRAGEELPAIPVSRGTDLSVVDLVGLAEPAVVRISTPFGVGTGIVIGESGEIVTNDHVISDNFGRQSREIQVLLSDGTTLPASVVGRDSRSDLAVIDVEGDGYSTLPLGRLADVRVGQDVVAIGFALDLQRGEGPSFSVTRGIVSAKNRGIRESSVILGAIQTDAAINPGNSGGPLLNLRGEVIGINTAIAPDRTTGGVAVGIGFAVGVDTIRAVYEEIMDTGVVNRGLLGIRDFEALRPAQARELGLPEDAAGVYLDDESDLSPEGPAALAGMLPGDVIASVGGYGIHTEGDLAVALIYNHADDTVPVEVYRDGERITLDVTLGTPPSI